MSEIAVISRLCRDCVDGACVDACPIECIYEERKVNGALKLPNQLFVNPEECIHCGACEPACPWEAIFDMSMVPDEFADDIALNALTEAEPKRFDVAVSRLTKQPTDQEIRENKRRWDRESQAHPRADVPMLAPR